MISKQVTYKISRASDRTKEFVKDWNRLSKTGRFDMAGLKKVMMLLVANDEPLPAQYKDHQLAGEWSDYRDCHVHGDFLLLYRLEGKGDAQRVVFARIGTHSELF